MFINQNRGREVHMAGQGPTDLADPSYFGNSSDDSDPNTGRYYVNKNNLPWAIAMPASFEYPAEKVDLVSAYHYFYLWAINGGQSNSDWYMNNTGYRNSSLIY
jgi:LruC domain-containing protein